MLDLNEKNKGALQMLKEQMVQEIANVKVEVKDIENDKKQIKIEFNTEDKDIHSNIDRVVAIKDIKPIREIRRGDIWYVDLGSNRKGSLQKNIRPWIILSNNISNRYSTNLNGCAITSQLGKTDLPVHVKVKGFGLKKESIILTETIESIDKNSQLLTYIGSVDEETLNKVEMAIKIQLGDLKPKTPIEKLPKDLCNKIEVMLDDILTYEKALSKAKNESLIKNLLEQREAFLWSLQKFCEDNKLNYRDYYKMYEKKEEKIAM